MSTRKTSNQQSLTERSIAESPYPLMAVRPRGVLLKSERRIIINNSREQFMHPTPPATPEKRRAEEPLSSPSPNRRKKDPYACLFIQRPPSGSPSSNSSTDRRHASSPLPSSSGSPLRRRVGNRDISGPSPGIFYAKVPQPYLGPPGQLPVIPTPDEDCVCFSDFTEVGCNMFGPDCVSREPLSITSRVITIGFKWKGYEVLGVYEKSVHISKNSSPFETRRAILGTIKELFVKFRNDVQADRVLRKGNPSNPEMDVLKYGDADFRVSKLERRYSSFYQVIFKVPVAKV